MKKIVLLFVTAFFVTSLVACEDICVGPECVVEGTENPGGEDPEECEDNNGGTTDGIVVENALPYVHINGEGHETDMNAFILLEYGKLRDYVKYQVTYLSCTCRPGDYNYWNTVFVEINKSTNTIRTISFTTDGENGHYNAGVWGDSSGAPEQNGITFEELEADYFSWYLGQSAADLADWTVFYNGDYHGITNASDITAENGDGELLVDAFAGSSVSTNNFLRVIKVLLEYHEENYSN